MSEKRVSPCPTSPGFGIGSEEEEEEEEADHMFTFRMGKRMQLAVTMDNKAKVSREKIPLTLQPLDFQSSFCSAPHLSCLLSMSPSLSSEGNSSLPAPFLSFLNPSAQPQSPS